MKVLVLHNDYQQAGGETLSVGAEIAALKMRGHDVQLLEISNDILSAVSRPEALRRVLGSEFSYQLVSDALRNRRVDVVHAQNLFPLLGAGAIKALQKYEVPWIRSLRNFRKRCLSANLFRDGETCTDCSTARAAVLGVGRGCYRESKVQSAVALAYANRDFDAERRYPPSAYVAVSKLVAEQVQESLVPGVPVVVKPNAVEHKSTIRTDGDRRGISFVGRLESHKGVDIVLTMASSMPDVPFTIIGDGPQSPLVRAANEGRSNIKWFRQLPNSEVLAVMASSQLIVAPSRWMEPFGRVAVEALSVGTVPLVGDVGGMREIVEKVDPSFALSVDDASEWVRRAAPILAMSKAQYGSYSASCISTYKEQYTVAANGKLLEQILEMHAVRNA